MQKELPDLLVTDGCIYVSANIKEPGKLLQHGQTVYQVPEVDEQRHDRHRAQGGGGAQQGHPQVGLQLGQILAEVGLGEIEAVSGPGDAVLLHNGEKIFRIFDKHGDLQSGGIWIDAFLFRHCTMKRPLYQQTPAEESVDSGVLARGGQVWYTA